MSTREIVVCPGNLLLQFDLSTILEHHRRSGASLTTVPLCRSTDQSLYVFNQCDIDNVADNPRTLEMLEQPFRQNLWRRLINSWAKYFGLIEQILSGGLQNIRPIGTQIRKGTWAHPDAKVSKKARIGQSCYIGTGAHVHAGATISGNTAIGARTILHRRSLVRNSLILNDTELYPGALADGVVACGDWAVHHDQIPNSQNLHLPLDCVRWVDQKASVQLERLA